MPDAVGGGPHRLERVGPGDAQQARRRRADLEARAHQPQAFDTWHLPLYLGFFSRTKSGERQLRKLGFDFPVNNLRHDLAIAVPTDLDRYFDFTPEPFIGSWPLDDANTVGVSSPKAKEEKESGEGTSGGDKEDLTEKEISRDDMVLAYISGLTNNVTQKANHEKLLKLKKERPSIFKDANLLRKVLELMAAYSFRLPTRRFIVGQLFDNSALTSEKLESVF